MRPLARQRIQRAQRLVHQQDGRVARQRPRDANALLHATRQLIGGRLLKLLKPQQLDEFTGYLFALRFVVALNP